MWLYTCLCLSLCCPEAGTASTAFPGTYALEAVLRFLVALWPPNSMRGGCARVQVLDKSERQRKPTDSPNYDTAQMMCGSS